MKKIFVAAVFIYNIVPGFTQTKHNQMEIETYMRFDKYPQFINRINSIAEYDLKITGNSWGVSGFFKLPIKKQLLIKTGAGFYRHSFIKILSKHRTFGEGNNRVINYPTTLGITVTTDKYWYNTANLILGFEKQFISNKNVQVLAGLNFINYFTFSQYYHLPYDNSFIPQPSLQIKNDYKTYNKRYFGLSSELYVGGLKKMNRVAIGPSVKVPVFDFWKQDDIFPSEINTYNRQKWFGGIGIGIIINYTL